MSLINFGSVPESRHAAVIIDPNGRPTRGLILGPDGKPARPALPFDATEIGPRLFQGSVPPRGGLLKQHGINALVLAAREHQFDARQFPGLRVIHCPMDDAAHVPAEEAKKAARQVTDLWCRGATVLITCHMGWNRSGLITALAWRYITGRSGKEAVRAVRSARGEDALSNKFFREYVSRLEPARRIEPNGSLVSGISVQHAGKSEESITGPALVLGALLFFGAFAARR